LSVGSVPTGMDRRTFLAVAATGASATTALAGCLGGGSALGSGGSTRDGTATTSTTGATSEGTPAEVTATDESTPTTDEGTPTFGSGPSFGEHPATRGVGSQPFLGPPPGEAEGTIVAFEDPSCPLCKRFENTTLPAIRSNLVETGKATYVFRGYPVVAPWGETAAKALEGAYRRDPAVHWNLLDHYYTNQDDLYGDNVADRTREYLAARTDFDVEAFLGELRDGAYDDAVETDLAAGENGGAGDVTPTVVLFKDGEYRTKARGSVSYSVVEAALGV
jgi:protein-disulfide isomerase